MKKIITSGVICVIIDQIIKALIINFYNIGESTTIIKNFFSITYVQNNGAAFSILSGNRVLLIGITIIAVLCIYYFLIKDEKKNLVLYGILYGGIIGNFIDRIFRESVVDFLDFKIFGYNYPVFNLADSFIVIGIIIMVIISIRKENHEGNSSRR